MRSLKMAIVGLVATVGMVAPIVTTPAGADTTRPAEETQCLPDPASDLCMPMP